MRAALFGLVAVCAQVGLSVPHGNQLHRHPARQLITSYSTVTDIVTVTAQNAVVWVDQYGNVISTEYRNLPTTKTVRTTSISHANSTTSATASTSAISTAILSTTPTPPFSPSENVQSPTTPEPTSADAPATTPSENPTTPGSSAAPSDTVSTTPVDKGSSGSGGYGICYELIGSNGCKDSSSLNKDFAFLASQGYSKVRVYDIGCDLGTVASAAAAQGLQLMAGLNTIGNVAGDLAKLVGMLKGNWGPVDTIVIGNEVVNSGGSAAAVVAALAAARPILAAAGFTKNIVTVDTFIAHQANPSLCQNSDYCAVNAHAFFDPNTVASNAGQFVTNAISGLGNGKRIVVTESGWPYQGQTNGQAIPSPQNQQAAMNSLKSAFSGNPGGLFLFQAYDASYKSPGYLGVEQYFGIYGH